MSDGLGSGDGRPLSISDQLRRTGPPPRTRQPTTIVSPQPAAAGGEEPNEMLLGDLDLNQSSGVIVNALSKQSSALTALVAHISAQGDSLLDFSSGSQSSSAMKGVQKREKLQAELAMRNGHFFLMLMQQIHRRLHPGKIVPKTEEELGDVSMLRYLKESGGYKNQRSLGLIQWILAHAVDAIAQQDFQGAKDIIALLAMSVEQANYDGGDWTVAYLISLLEEPPIVLFQERTAPIMSTGRPFSPLIPPSWTAITLGYIKDMELLATKKPEVLKKKGTEKPATEESPSPKRKPRFPKRPKQAQEEA